jgi:ATP-dependent helicase HrpA
MLEDKYLILEKLDRLDGDRNFLKSGREIYGRLSALAKQAAASTSRREKRLTEKPIISHPPHLPIYARMSDIIRAISENQVVIISGDTGSGKSTQIPKMCLEAGQGIAGKIACTQPRRIAAITIARRIAEELNEKIGNSVGYKIRFSDRTSPESYIKILTDGMLLAETQKDPLLTEYDTLIIDEAHERNLNVDFLLGIIRNLIQKRKDLKIIITSATLDTKKFSLAFDGAKIIKVEGRSYPVKVEYLFPELESDENEEISYIEMVVKAVEGLEKRRLTGDILIFMPTEADIREACELLEARAFSRTKILPLFARLTSSQQKRVFATFSGRKIVISTNVAETSLTIPGIKYVIDTGLARIPSYNSRTRTTSLPITPISKSSADQRKGRCGRMENGICIRLYSEEDYLSRPEFTPPEILRSNLADVILRMMSLRLGNINEFPFLDRPHKRSIKDGIDLLIELGAVFRKKNMLSLTRKGKLMARVPLDPKISRMMLEAIKEGCVPDVAIIASVLSIQDPRERPLEKSKEADRIHASFRDPESDFLTLTNIWNKYQRAKEKLGSQNRLRKFCKENFLSYVRMREWQDIHEQIISILKEQKIKTNIKDKPKEPLYNKVHRSILSGYLSNIAMKKEKNIYAAAKGREVMIFPGSAIFGRGFQWITSAEIVKTSRMFARTAARVDPTWLESLGSEVCKRTYSEAHWEKNRGEVVAFEKVTLFGLPIVTRRPVSYGSLDPEQSQKIFALSALVKGEVKENFQFLKYNLSLQKEIAGLEDKTRRKGLLLGELDLAQLYMDKLPGVCDIRSLKKRIKSMNGDDSLRFKKEDIIIEYPDEAVLSKYPDYLDEERRNFPISYRFAPGTEEDGLTVRIPSTLTPQFPNKRTEWLVPGLLKEKITVLIKALPKRYRKKLVPVSDTVEIILNNIERTEEPLVNALSRFIYNKFGVDIPASEWPDSQIPDHLRMRFSIIDHDGKEIKTGRDKNLLENSSYRIIPGNEEPTIWRRAREKWERSGITRWDFGDIPSRIQIGSHVKAYPALVPKESSVEIHLFPTREQSADMHVRGVANLYTIHFSKDIKFLKRTLDLPEEIIRGALYFGGIDSLETAIFECLSRSLFELDLRKEVEFYELAEKKKPDLLPKLGEIVDMTAKIVGAFYKTTTKIQSIEKANTSNDAVMGLCASIRVHLKSLVPRDFLTLYGDDRLKHLPRYIKAMEIRAERGAFDLGKDKKKENEIKPFTKIYEKIMHEASEYISGEKGDALEEYFWMLEEYKVSLFAPELKTPFPVSQKRMKNKADEIERMI